MHDNQTNNSDALLRTRRNEADHTRCGSGSPLHSIGRSEVLNSTINTYCYWSTKGTISVERPNQILRSSTLTKFFVPTECHATLHQRINEISNKSGNTHPTIQSTRGSNYLGSNISVLINLNSFILSPLRILTRIFFYVLRAKTRNHVLKLPK